MTDTPSTINPSTLKKMSIFTNRKMRDLKSQPAWIVVFDETAFGGTTYEVMKNNQADTLKEYATCMVRAISPATGELGDMGDMYWAQTYHGMLIEVDGNEPTANELLEWASLSKRAANDPMSALGL